MSFPADETVRLIASDLDGTLLAANGRLSPRTLAAIEAATAAGIVFAAATGRSHITAVPRLAVAAPAMRWAVCSNGASLYDLHAEQVVRRYPIADDHIGELGEVWDRIDGIALGWEAEDGFGADRRFQDRHPGADGLAQAPTHARPPASGVLKILVSHDRLSGYEMIDVLRQHLPAGMEAACSGAPFVEVTAAGVNKAHGVSRLAADLGISAEHTVVFGDNNNDLSMFAWAGRAVAVANATDEARAAAHDLTAHHDDDGVARFVEDLLSR